MTEEFENLLGELKKLPRGTENAPEYLRHLMRLFVADFETSMSKRLDVKFWSKMKNLMDEMREASGNDRLVDTNTQSLAVGFLMDLSLLCHSNYQIHDFGLPEQMTWRGMEMERKVVRSRKNSKVFAAYLMLRMGDLMRYRNSLRKAREYYELSSRINPADGAVWNQLGVTASLSAQFLEAVFFHTRALHSTLEFSAASSSLTAIFKKFANKDPTKSMPMNDLFLTCLAKIHFLLEIEKSDEILEKMGKSMGESKEMIVSLMSVFEHLEGGTELEDRSIEYVHVIWRHAHRRLLEILIQNLKEMDSESILPKFHENLILFEFLNSFGTMENSEDVERIQKFLRENSEEFVKDSNGFAYFKCLHNLKFPLKYGNLMEKIGEKSMENLEEKLEFEEEENDGKEEKVFRNESDSDEEVLQRGRRRGRAKQLESLETDDEDF